MKTAICAIAKNENLYINDWVKYHLDLGFDKIFIFDNNDLSAPYIGACIDKRYSDRVFIIPVNEFKQFQKQAYNDFYSHFAHFFDWCAIIDVDEFIVLRRHQHLEDFLKSFKNVECIRLNWQIYGDDGIVSGDTSVPVYKRIVKKLNHDYNYHAKCIVRGNLSHVAFESVHYPMVNGRMPTQVTPSKLPLTDDDKIVLSKCDHSKAYLAHYMTKTWEEFKKQKLGRSDAALTRTLGIEYYFRINPETRSKIPTNELV